MRSNRRTWTSWSKRNRTAGGLNGSGGAKATGGQTMGTMMKMRGFVLLVAAVVPCATPVLGQSTSDYGTPSGSVSSAPAGMSFLVGNWTVKTLTRHGAGQFVESPGTTFYRARWLHDGLSLLAEFYEESRDGLYGVHVVTYDSERGLVHSYFNARANRRIEFTGEFRDGEYYLSRQGGYGAGPHLYREVDSDISPDSFVKRSISRTTVGARGKRVTTTSGSRLWHRSVPWPK